TSRSVKPRDRTSVLLPLAQALVVLVVAHGLEIHAPALDRGAAGERPDRDREALVAAALALDVDRGVLGEPAGPEIDVGATASDLNPTAERATLSGVVRIRKRRDRHEAGTGRARPLEDARRLLLRELLDLGGGLGATGGVVLVTDERPPGRLLEQHAPLIHVD